MRPVCRKKTINNYMSQNRKNIGILTPPIERAGIIPLLSLIRIFDQLGLDIYLITGGIGYDYFKNYNGIHTFNNNLNSGRNTLTRIKNYIFFQIQESKRIFLLSKKVDLWFFMFTGECQLFPMLMAKLCRKKVIIIITGSAQKTLEIQEDFLGGGLKILTLITSALSDRILLYSNKLIDEYGFTRWNKKILIAHRHFLDFTTFTVITPYIDRPPLIGYIGRLSEEKGVQHFIQALPAIFYNNDHLHHQDLRAFIGGDGQLKEWIKASLQKGGFTDRVNLLGWVAHDDLPKYLNQLRLLILPSYTEGLPNIMLEAMACGTPVLATPVGAIPDVIIDGKTGFIMDNNTPECIAENVKRALACPELEEIVKAGRRYVGEEHYLMKVKDNWGKIIQDI